MKTIVRSFATNNLVEGHDIYTKFMEQRFKSLKKDGKESEVLFYKRGKAGKVGGDFKESQYRDIYKWHCITISYNIWSELVKDCIVPDKTCINYKKHVDVSEDILKKFKYRVEQSIKNAKCDYNGRLPRANIAKGPYDACRYLTMYWTYLDLAKDCKTQRYFPNGPTIVRAQKIFDYDKYINPFFMNGKFSKSAVRKVKETKEVADTTNCIVLEDLDFSMRTYNILKRAYINTLDDILNKNCYDMMRIIGHANRHCFSEIIEKLKELGYEYRETGKVPQKIEKTNDVLLVDIIDDARLTNPLHRAGIHTVNDFLAKSEKELLKIRTFGIVKLKKVREAIDKHVKQPKEESVIDIAEQAAKEVAEERKGLDISVKRFKGNPYLHVNVDNTKRINELNEKLEKAKDIVTDLQKTLAEKNQIIANLENKIDDSNKRIDDILGENAKLNSALNGYKSNDVLRAVGRSIDLMKEQGITKLDTCIGGYSVEIMQKYIIASKEAGHGRV